MGKEEGLTCPAEAGLYPLHAHGWRGQEATPEHGCSSWEGGRQRKARERQKEGQVQRLEDEERGERKEKGRQREKKRKRQRQCGEERGKVRARE